MPNSLRAFARRVRSTLRPPSAILCYHRVAKPAADPWALAVSPENFESQIAALKTRRRVVPVAEFVHGWVRGSLPAGTIALSFDDGYLDALSTALPIVERHSVPATMFLPTGLMGEASFWWDELVALIALSRPARAATLRHHHLAVEIPTGDPPWNRNWRAWHAPTTQRERSLLEAWSAIKQLEHASRTALLAGWRDQLADAAPAADGRPMTNAEAKALLRNPLFALGAHTVSHVPLAEIERSIAIAELTQSRLECDALAGKPVKGLAYPFGQHSPDVDALAAEAGFDWALGLSEPRTAERSAFSVPRLCPPDIDGRSLLRLIGA